MGKKLTAEQRAARRKRKAEYEIIFINGKQKRVRREPTIEGLEMTEFLRRNADSCWLAQNEMWELLFERESQSANESHFDERNDL